MVDRPILFSAPMIRAKREGRKRMTRRVLDVARYAEFLTGYSSTGLVKEYDGGRFGLEFVHDELGLWHGKNNPKGRSGWYVPVPYAIGDRLWVREAWRAHRDHDRIAPRELLDGSRSALIAYDADGDTEEWLGRPRPSIHMPRAFSRLTLLVESVKVERLQDISEEDAIAEGIASWHQSVALESPRLMNDWCLYSARVALLRGEQRPLSATNVGAFALLWDTINGHGAWNANPFVAAIGFSVIHQNIDAIEPAQREIA